MATHLRHWRAGQHRLRWSRNGFELSDRARRLVRVGALASGVAVVLTLSGVAVAVPGPDAPGPGDSTPTWDTTYGPGDDGSIQATFDWSVPEGPRPDEDGNGVPDLPVPRSVIHRKFPVNLDGCGSTASAEISSYEWRVTMPGSGQVTLPETTCQATFEAPTQGTYPVRLIVHTTDGRQAVKEGSAAVRDILIVSIGDSYASGEGNPDARAVPAPDPYVSCPPPSPVPGLCTPAMHTPATWADKRCHRSWNSGPAKTALAIEQSDPKTSVTFVSVACSGAEIDEGLLGGYAGREPPPGSEPLIPQVEQVRRLLCPEDNSRGCLGDFRNSDPRRIDALMISVGGNDVGFGDIIEACGRPYDNCIQDSDVPHRSARVIQSDWLLTQYQRLNDELRKKLTFSQAYLTEYPNPFHNADGAICDKIVLRDAGREATEWYVPSTVDGEISNWEAWWLNDFVAVPLNQRIKEAAQSPGIGWTFVDGIDEAAWNHGYCNDDDHWVNRYEEAIGRQGNKFGAFHPNAAGHQNYATALERDIRPDLAAKPARPIGEPGNCGPKPGGICPVTG